MRFAYDRLSSPMRCNNRCHQFAAGDRKGAVHVTAGRPNAEAQPRIGQDRVAMRGWVRCG